ncbi:hypothetical protein DFJ58DRAFT_747986 [Suillus subalutaceus]|uniref:uncharacterized protein n=1 Tax=Suillus subalutaceus TaxID=48586 RepID=UPI001B85EA11|nr:uncharacterized protein DFJ58DRAFT_747986 [Suillus subalutaceus]KAG1842979.1 hypothetical protein DFJ58DRAFT_747986 [Suillus subalutaceus]
MHNRHPLLGLAINVVSDGQDAQADLDAADSFQDISQNPQEIRRCYWEDCGCTSICKDGTGHVVLCSLNYSDSSGSRRSGSQTSHVERFFYIGGHDTISFRCVPLQYVYKAHQATPTRIFDGSQRSTCTDGASLQGSQRSRELGARWFIGHLRLP